MPTDLLGLITELGGGGAIMGSILTAWAKAKEREFQRETQRIESADNRVDKTREFFKEALNQTAELAFISLIITSTIVLLSPIILPLISDVTVHYFYPKSGSFFFFDWSNLHEITAGTGSNHIMVLPIHISLCSNFIGFFLSRRALQ